MPPGIQSPFERPELHQYLTRTRGPIVHLAPVMAGLPGGTAEGHLPRIILDLVKTQRQAGFNSVAVIPGLRPESYKHGSIPHFNMESVDGVPVFVLGNQLESPYPFSPASFDSSLSFSQTFWKFMGAQFGDKVSIVHAHDYSMGLVLASHPLGQKIKTIFSPYDPDYDYELPLERDYVGAGTQPLQTNVCLNLMTRSNPFCSGALSGVKMGVLGTDRTVFWSEAHRNMFFEDADYGPFFNHETNRGINFTALGTSWTPRLSALMDADIKRALHLVYYETYFGGLGLDFAIALLRDEPEDVKNLVYLGAEWMSETPGRRDRALGSFAANPRLTSAVQNIAGYGMDLDPEFSSSKHVGTLGTFLWGIDKGTGLLSQTSPVFYLVNDTGLASRETPITQFERGSKGSVVVGKSPLNVIVAVGLDSVAKQLPPGEWVVLTACDNLKVSGCVTVGDHLLSEDGHGIFNMTLPKMVVGPNIPDGDPRLQPLMDLGLNLVDESTGAKIGFREKLPTVREIQKLSESTGGIVDVNTMIKLIRRDIALLFNDADHYGRACFYNGKPIIEAYAEMGAVPDWSKLFDEASVGSVTQKAWMEKANARDNECFDRRDFRLLWYIANDIVLSSLEPIAFADERYFGGTKIPIDQMKSIYNACVRIMVAEGAHVGAGSGDPEPAEWYFKRDAESGLRGCWKEVFLSAMAVRHSVWRDASWQSSWDAAAHEASVTQKWEGLKPAGVDKDIWSSLWASAKSIHEHENGIGAARINGTWIDTGTKRDLFNAWLKIVSPDIKERTAIRLITGLQTDTHIEQGVAGREFITASNIDSVYVGGESNFCPDSGNGNVVLGRNVVIINSKIRWAGGTLHIPDNTVIVNSELVDIDPVVQENEPKLIYGYKNTQNATFQLSSPLLGDKTVKFGFYGGVVTGTMQLKDGRLLHTIFPMDLNLKGTPNMDLLDQNMSNPFLRAHFKAYYAQAADVLSTSVPFTGMKADEILWEIGF